MLIEEHGSEIDDKLLESVCKLHIQGLDYRSFITKLGGKFLKCYYTALLETNRGFLVVAREGNELLGFILAAEDSSKIFNFSLKRLGRLAFMAGLGLLRSRKPFRLLLQIIKVFFSYSALTDNKVKAELIAIVVDEKKRSRKIGHELLAQLSGAFLKRKVSEFKVTVHDEMIRSNQFYIKEGFVLSHKFKLQNEVIWNVYIRKINNSNSTADLIQ